MGLAWNICAPLGTLSTFFFNPVFQVSTAKNEINLFNNHILIEAPVTFAPAGAMTPSAEFLCYIRAARVVSRGRDFNTIPNRTFVPFVSVAQNVCCLSLLREMVRLSQLDRGRAIALILQGRSQRYVSHQFGVQESTISRLVQRLRATGRLTDRPRSGRPRITTQRQDRRIRLVHLHNRLRTATETAKEVIRTHGHRVCPRTVRNRLREFYLRPRPPYMGPNLTPRRRQRRMQWLRAHAPNRFRLVACNVQRWVTIFASAVR